MTLKEHVAVSLFAAWRALTSGEEALKFVEGTPLGVVRSFMALSFALPLFVIITWLQLRGAPDGFPIIPAVFMFLAYAISWVTYAVLVFYTYATVGHQQEFFRFMVLFNWARVYAALVMVPFFALESLGVLTGWMAIGIWGFSASAVLTYKVIVARIGLGIHVFPAIIFVLLDVAIFIFLEFLALKAVTLIQ